MELIRSKTPLPATVEEMISRRTMPYHRTLNDHVDDLHLKLWVKSDEYKRLLDAVSDEDAVEGSLSIDNAKAAEMIRNEAVSEGDTLTSGKKLASIVKSLNVVLRRYHMTRKERACTIGGEMISSVE